MAPPAQKDQKDAPEVDGQDAVAPDHYAESECAHLALAKILNLANLKASVSAAQVIEAITSSKVDIGGLQERTAGL